MTSTLTSYNLVARDLPAALKRKAAEPAVARESAYYAAHIGAVKTVDDLLGDKRLFAYAMKAFGLEDMTYAKAFMRKVMTEGTASSSSFANRLADDRYVAFAKAFDFTAIASARGSDAGADGTEAAAASITAGTALPAKSDFSGTNAATFTLTTQLASGTMRSAAITLDKATLTGLAGDLAAVTPAEILAAIGRQIDGSDLQGSVKVNLDVFDTLMFSTTDVTDLGADGTAGGVGPDADTTYAGAGSARSVTLRVAAPAAGGTALDIGFGTDVAPDLAAQTVTDAYLRQSLEADAGTDDTGVRLALYFARKASTIGSAYDILGDSALTQVANTLTGLPATSSASDSDALKRRADLIASKIDIKSLQDPDKVAALVKRFAAIWDAQNNTESAPVLALFGDGGDGISDALLLSAQSSRLGN